MASRTGANPVRKTRSRRIAVSVRNRTAGALPLGAYRSFIENAAARLAQRTIWPREMERVGVALVVPAESRRLNRRRRQDRATNVLSFDYGVEGEIILCPAVARREARASGESFGSRMRRLFLHGLVHLSGLHHERSAAAGECARRLEEELFREAGAGNT